MKKKEIFNLVSDLLTKYTQSGLPTFEGQTTIINSNGFLKELHENLLISAEKWFIEITSNTQKNIDNGITKWTRNGITILKEANQIMSIRATDWDLITEEGEFETPKETKQKLILDCWDYSKPYLEDQDEKTISFLCTLINTHQVETNIRYEG